MIQGHASTFDWWLQEQSAKLINHPISHQGLIDMGFELSSSAQYFGSGNIFCYKKLNFKLNYNSGEGFTMLDRYSINTECHITHESQLRQLYLTYTGFQL
jgi:hypothetical protein